MTPFNAARTVRLTSTTSSQTTTIPAGFTSLVVFNGGGQPLYLAMGASVAIPAVGTWGDNLVCVQPGTTQVFGIPNTGGTLAYIADTTGGPVVLSVGTGV